MTGKGKNNIDAAPEKFTTAVRTLKKNGWQKICTGGII